MTKVTEIHSILIFGRGKYSNWKITDDKPVPKYTIIFDTSKECFYQGDGIKFIDELEPYIDLKLIKDMDLLLADLFKRLALSDKDKFCIVDSTGNQIVYSGDVKNFHTTKTAKVLFDKKSDLTHKHTVDQIAGVKPAATRATGILKGDVPLVGANGKLPKSIVGITKVLSNRQSDMVSYLALAHIEKLTLNELNSKNSKIDNFIDDSNIDLNKSDVTPKNSSVVFTKDKTLMSKVITSDKEPSKGKLLFSGSDEIDIDSKLKIELTRNDGTVWSPTSLTKLPMVRGTKGCYSANCNFATREYKEVVDLTKFKSEDLKEDITEFIVDRRRLSGHFNKAIGARLQVGCTIYLEGDVKVNILKITGNGTALNSVSITGTLEEGTYKVTKVCPFRLVDGTLHFSSTDTSFNSFYFDNLLDNYEDIKLEVEYNFNDANLDTHYISKKIGDSIYLPINQTFKEIVKYDLTNKVWKYLDNNDTFVSSTYKDYLSVVTEFMNKTNRLPYYDKSLLTKDICDNMIFSVKKNKLWQLTKVTRSGILNSQYMPTTISVGVEALHTDDIKHDITSLNMVDDKGTFNKLPKEAIGVGTTITIANKEHQIIFMGVDKSIKVEPTLPDGSYVVEKISNLRVDKDTLKLGTSSHPVNTLSVAYLDIPSKLNKYKGISIDSENQTYFAYKFNDSYFVYKSSWIEVTRFSNKKYLALNSNKEWVEALNELEALKLTLKNNPEYKVTKETYNRIPSIAFTSLPTRLAIVLEDSGTYKVSDIKGYFEDVYGVLEDNKFDMSTCELEDHKGLITSFTVDYPGYGHFDAFITDNIKSGHVVKTTKGDIVIKTIANKGNKVSDVEFYNDLPIGTHAILGIYGVLVTGTKVKTIGAGKDLLMEAFNLVKFDDTAIGKSNPTLAYFNDKVFEIGGYDSSGNPIKDIFTLDIKLNTIEKHQVSLINEIEGHRSAQGKQFVYFLGGKSENSKDLYSLDLTTMKFTLVKSLDTFSSSEDFSMCFGDDTLFMYGGKTSTGKSKELWAHNLITKNTYVKSESNTFTTHSACVYFDDVFYAFGGLNHEDKLIEHVAIFSIKDNTWDYKPLPFGLSHAKAIVINKDIYILGGKTSTGTNNQLIKYSNVEFELLDKLEELNRYDFGITQKHNQVFLCGGKNHEDKVLSFRHKVAIAKRKIQKLPDGLTKLFGSCLLSTKDKVYLYGGKTKEGIVPSLLEFDKLTHTFTSKTSGTNLYNHQGVVYEDKLYFVGGKTLGEVDNSIIQVYDTKLDTWSTLNINVVGTCLDIEVFKDKLHIYVKNTVDKIYVVDPKDTTTISYIEFTNTVSDIRLVKDQYSLYMISRSDKTFYLKRYDDVLDTWKHLATLETMSQMDITSYNVVMVDQGINLYTHHTKTLKYFFNKVRNTWEYTGVISSLEYKRNIAVTNDDEYVYFYGGCGEDSTSICSEFYRERVEYYPWSVSQYKEKQIDLSAHAKSCYHNRYIYMTTGQSNTPNVFVRLNVDTLVQERLADLIRPAVGAPLVHHKNKVYVFSGLYAQSTLSTYLMEYSIKDNTWKQLASGPLPRIDHTSCIYNDKLIVFGGKDLSGNSMQDMWEYDITQDKWKKLLDNAGIDYRMCTLFVHSNTLHLITVNEHVCNIYEYQENTLKLIATRKNQDITHTNKLVGNNLYSLGANTNGNSSIWKFDLTNCEWVYLGEYFDRSLPLVEICDNKLWLFSGHHTFDMDEAKDIRICDVYDNISQPNTLLIDINVSNKELQAINTYVYNNTYFTFKLNDTYQIYKDNKWIPVVRPSGNKFEYCVDGVWSDEKLQTAQSAITKAVSYTTNQMNELEVRKLLAINFPIKPTKVSVTLGMHGYSTIDLDGFTTSSPSDTVVENGLKWKITAKGDFTLDGTRLVWK